MTYTNPPEAVAWLDADFERLAPYVIAYRHGRKMIEVLDDHEDGPACQCYW